MLVYSLSHPVTGEVRYVGKSERGLKRPRQHGTLSNLRKTHLPVVRWIKKLRDQGLDYVIEVVEEFPDRSSLMEAERFYIAYFRSLGFRLLNLCEGGEGFTGRHTEEVRRKIGEASKLRGQSQETRMKLSKMKRGIPLSEEHRAALRTPHLRARGVARTAETRAKISASMKARFL